MKKIKLLFLTVFISLNVFGARIDSANTYIYNCKKTYTKPIGMCKDKYSLFLRKEDISFRIDTIDEGKIMLYPDDFMPSVGEYFPYNGNLYTIRRAIYDIDDKIIFLEF